MNDPVTEVSNKINDELDAMFMTHDTKLLATCLAIRSAAALRALHSTGVWTIDDVSDVVYGAFEDVFKPLPSDKLPRVITSICATKQ